MTLEEYLRLPYHFEVIHGEYGNLVVQYPDLPGCVTQVETYDEVGSAAQEILRVWLELAIEDGADIPLPTESVEYSGRFVVRIEKSLHQALALTAEREGVSLNHHVSRLLAQGNIETLISKRLDEICATLDEVHADIKLTDFFGIPRGWILDDQADIPALAA